MRRVLTALQTQTLPKQKWVGAAAYCFAAKTICFPGRPFFGGQGFGVFPELQVTHLISAGRLSQGYFLRLMHDHAFSHGILDYLGAGILAEGASLFRYSHLVLHGIRRGLFSMKCQWMASRGRKSANRFISEHRLEPIKAGPHESACMKSVIRPD